MTTAQQRLVELYRKRVDNSLLEAEAEEFLQLLQHIEAEQVLSPLLYEGWKKVAVQDNAAGISEEQIDSIMKALPVDNQVHSGVVVNGRLRYIRNRWAAAAAVLLLVAIGWWMVSRTHVPDISMLADTNTVIKPGKDGAILTLSDGRQVQLDSIQNGVVAHQGGADVRIKDGMLYYEGQSVAALYNTIYTPKGHKYNIILPDGTLVWLNAASSIRYSTAFTGQERRVEVTGEVYFEVAKRTDSSTGRRIPFLVNVNNKSEVEVLGTHFNINAYDNESSINITLLEGKVRVKRGNDDVSLMPGQQAQILPSSSQLVRVLQQVDTEQVIAWKNNLFNFDGASLEEAMRQLERWYDIEVRYESGVPDIRLRGEMTKGVKLNQLLIALEQLGLHYKLEGRKLIILH